MGPQGLLVVRLPAPFVSHSASLGPATATRVLSVLVPVSTPPTGLDVFLFYLLGVGLPCRWIFCQFWLCEEAQCVYLRRHLGSLRLFLIQACLLPKSCSPAKDYNLLPKGDFPSLRLQQTFLLIFLVAASCLFLLFFLPCSIEIGCC